MSRGRVGHAVAVLALLVAVPVLAGFSGTDVFLPSVGAKPGVAPAVWHTTVWVHNPNGTAANVTFSLLERQANPSPRAATDTIPAGDTRRYDDAVKSLFGVETFGAIRVTANVKVDVSSRIYSQTGTLDDSVGQFFAGVPASFAIGSGESTEQGFYLHPELYGEPAERGVAWARSLGKRRTEPAERTGIDPQDTP